MIALDVRNLSKQFADAAFAAVDDITFQVESGEILALVGPSGCGKTTTLRLIAGLDDPDAGEISLNGQLVATAKRSVPPEQRGVGMVFQDHALFPHLTVFENVRFGLRGGKSNHRDERVNEMLRMVGLDGLAGRYPQALSGGERQRVALGRALMPEPVLVLMDEPFSSLDADLRAEVRELTRGILKSMQATVVFVTHDQEEALYMGDRLAVLRGGRLEQIGTPEEIFHASGTRFVAEFMGSSDFMAGVTTPEGIHTEIGLLPQVVSSPPGTQVEIALRADDVGFDLAEGGNGIIAERFFRGAFNVYRLRLDSGQVLHAFKGHDEIMAAGARVQVRISAEHPLSVFKDGVAV